MQRKTYKNKDKCLDNYHEMNIPNGQQQIRVSPLLHCPLPRTCCSSLVHEYLPVLVLQVTKTLGTHFSGRRKTPKEKRSLPYSFTLTDWLEHPWPSFASYWLIQEWQIFLFLLRFFLMSCRPALWLRRREWFQANSRKIPARILQISTALFSSIRWTTMICSFLLQFKVKV